MARFTSNFNSKRFMTELEREAKAVIQQEINDHPEEILSEYVGNLIDAVCPGCEHTEMMIIPNGKARCPLCGYTDKVQLELNWG